MNQPQNDNATVSRQQAIKLARESAFAHSHQHSYLPQTREEADRWQPHEWVLLALQAGQLPSAPGIDLQRLIPPEWLSEQVGGEFDDLRPGQAWRMGFNECRVRVQLLVDQALGFPEPPAASAQGPRPRGDLVPGVVRCAKCSFQLTRTNLYLGSGTTGPGGSETEPCPNGCGPLWPITWQTWATEGWEQAERYHDELRQLQDSPKGGSDAQSHLGAMTDLLARWRHNAAVESSPLQAGKVRREVWAQCLSELEFALQATSAEVSE